MLVPTARGVAASVLARVILDKAFASAALDAELERAAQLEPRDRGLATELVYGTLRLFPWLDDRIARYAPRGVEGLEPLVRAHLVIAAYQVLVLTRVPAFAAVNEAVSAIRETRGGAKVAGFANAVLRKLAAEKRPTEDELAEATLASVDPSLVEAITRAIGAEGARALLVGVDAAPVLGVRVEDAAQRDAWLARFQETRPSATFEAGKVSPHAILARGAGKLVDFPGHTEGAWTPQEEGSQVVALALGAGPGETVLDACAGRGNKTGLLGRAVGPQGAVDAADVHPKKLDRLVRELARIDVHPRKTLAIDWSLGVGQATPEYDRILVDAPCSGTGTLRRRPELALRRMASDVAELAKLQRAILEHAATLVKPGGRLVYAVCSVLCEEAEDVIAGAAELGLEPAPFTAPSLRAWTDGPTLRLLPHVHGTDGYFLASFVRRA